MKYAKHVDSGNPIYINEATRGIKCQCICLGCGEVVVAAQGDVNDWYFRHHRPSHCTGAQDTAIHYFVKKILLQNQYLHTRERTLKYIAAFEETKYLSIQPDVILFTGTEHICVEVNVTHSDFDKGVFYESNWD